MSGSGVRIATVCRSTRAVTTRGALLLGSLFGLSCGNGQPGNHRSIDVRLGNECFAVPGEYAGALDAPPFLPGLVSRLGHTHLRLLIPGAELRKAAPGYVSNAPGEIVVGISVATEIERSRLPYRALNYDKSLWSGRGVYSRRTIEPVPGAPYFRVCLHERYCLLVDSDPSSVNFDPAKPGTLVAICTTFHSTNVPLCTVAGAADRHDWVLEFGLREEDVSRRQAVAEHILHQVDSWRRPC